MHIDEMSGAAAIRRRGVTVAEKAGGLADRELGVTCTPQTRFQIASVSKQFTTAAAVLLLVIRQKVSLDDPVSPWLDRCPPDWRTITIRHLLTHTSGVGHWDDFPALDLYQPIEVAQELAIFQQQPLLSAPGNRYHYSSPGYVLLAWIVQRAANQPYAGFLAERIFEPLGLHSATAGDPPSAGMAFGYDTGERVPSVDLATVGIGAGDLWCTAGDLLRWDEAIANDELLPAALRTEMLTPAPVPGSAGNRGDWCLTLATNAIVCWSSEYHGLGVAALRRDGRDVDDEVLAHIWPTHHENVHFYGAHSSTSTASSPSWIPTATGRYAWPRLPRQSADQAPVTAVPADRVGRRAPVHATQAQQLPPADWLG